MEEQKQVLMQQLPLVDSGSWPNDDGRLNTTVTVTVNTHTYALRIQQGNLTQDEFNDLCKLLELHGYDVATTCFSVKVDTKQRDQVFISQVPASANRHTRRIAAKMERKDARRR